MLAGFLFSCSSPMDVKTPRIVTPIDQIRLHPALTEVITEANDEPVYFLINVAKAELDTFANPPRIWMDFSFDAAYDTSAYANKIKIKNFKIKLDSTQFAESLNDITGSENYNSEWMKLTIQRDPEHSKDTTISCGPEQPSANISFIMNKEKHEILAFLYTKITDRRYWKEERDTIIDDGQGNKILLPIITEKSAPDSISFRATFKLKY